MIDLCSDTASSGEEDCSLISFSPIKSKTIHRIRGILLIPQILLKACVDYGDYHDFEHKVPVLSRVTFTIGSVPVDRICREKPNAVTYSSVFVVDLPCIRCIDDLRADDNSAWVRGGKPRKTYNIKCDGTGSQSHLWRVI